MSRAIVAGSLAQRPNHGGHAWVFLQYLLGLRRLGWDVVFLDRLEPDMCFDGEGRPTRADRSLNLRYLVDVMELFGFGDDAYAVLHDSGRQTFGMSRPELLAHARESSFLLNVMGFVEDEEILGSVGCRVFLDIDPGFGQMWAELGLHDMFQGHDRYVTIGQNIGSAGCSIPTCGIQWLTTKPPVVLERWPAEGRAGGAITSVASWRGPFAPIERGGRTFGLRVHEFRKFMELPRHTGERFELALDIHEAEELDRAALAENGWVLLDPRRVAGRPHAYRDFIRLSKAELMVAKNMYVATNSGWISDRSVCYLASGKPVIAQDTGLPPAYTKEGGLVTFRSLDEAVARVRELGEAYEHHARAARRVAEEHFDSDTVLLELLTSLGIA